MRVIVVGMGVQGHKRKAVAGKDVVATVDPINPSAEYKNILDVPLMSFDSALLCIPDEPKVNIIEYLLENGKNVLVEKPLFASNSNCLHRLQDISERKKVVCYTAYNHRFEPHFVRMKELLDSKVLGRIYSVKMFYGNGTARLVRNSEWRDKGDGVLPDLGSHLLDTASFWFGQEFKELSLYSANRFENRAFDHITFGTKSTPLLQFELTLLSWRNHFYADVIAENGSAHINSLCKWGPSTFTFRKRVLPSGRPNEEVVTLVQEDPTWSLEYEHFKKLCKQGSGNIHNDIWINEALQNLSAYLV